MKYRKCITCNEVILRSARFHPYMCRGCEKELRQLRLEVPVFFGER